MQQTRNRGGRPRPAETIERDERILALLAGGPSSRGAIARAAGLEVGLVRLALERLHRAGRIRQCLASGTVVWTVADGQPCP